MSYGVITGTVTSGSDVALMARIRGSDGQLMTAESISAIAWQATDVTAGTLAASGTYTPAAVIFDTLVTGDPRWSIDSSDNPSPKDASYGYNFLAVVPYTTFPATGVALAGTAPHVYQVDVQFTPVVGGQFVVVWAFAPVVVYL